MKGWDETVVGAKSSGGGHSTSVPVSPCPTPLAPRVIVEPTRVLYLGPAMDLAPHRNAVATLAIAFDTAFQLTLPTDGLRRCRSALIPPHTFHHLVADGPMAFLYLDELSADFACLHACDLEAAAASIRSLFVRNLPPDAVLEVVRGAFHLPVRTSRLGPTVRAIHESPSSFDRIEAAAGHAGLSVSRFQHIFRREVGVPFRRYRLWARMIHVSGALRRGATLTRAAHDAGFSSSAHLSASFKDMFGISPSRLLASGVTFELASPVVMSG